MPKKWGKRQPWQTKSKKYYYKNIPALIAAIIIGIFIILVPIIDRKPVYKILLQIPYFLNSLSLPIISILISMFAVLAIFCLFLLNGLGLKPNKYSKYAGILCVLYFLYIFLINVFSVGNTSPISVSGITLISYWIASLSVPVVGIVYLIFFETFDWNKRNHWKIVSFSIICIISLFFIGIIMPVILSSIGLLGTGGFGDFGYSANSKYHVGEIATDQSGQKGFAITSDDGQGHYTVEPVYLDYSQAGWHTNGKVAPQIMDYQSVEQQYPIEWGGGNRMDIAHIPDKDWTAPENWKPSYSTDLVPHQNLPKTNQPTSSSSSETVSNPGPQVAPPASLPPQSTPIQQNSPTISLSTDGIEQSIFQQINNARASNGVKSLSWDSSLVSIARSHSQDMATNHYIGHVDPQGNDPTARATKQGYNVRKDIGNNQYQIGIGEIIAQMPAGNVQFTCPSELQIVPDTSNGIASAMMDAWMNHDSCQNNGHRNNILNSGYDHVGIGVAYDGQYYIATGDFW